MSGGMALPQAAARLWGDPASRQQILDMHARGDSLIDMVDALGLTPALEADGLRDVLANLTDDEVTLIRDAFVAEAQVVGDRPGASFPIDCRVGTIGSRVRVIAAPVSPEATAPVARIESA